MMARIMKMTAQQANTYLNWQYPEPYTFYNFPPSISRSELLNELLASNSDYFSILDDDNQLFGIYEYQFHNGVMEIGLGIRKLALVFAQKTLAKAMGCNSSINASLLANSIIITLVKSH